MPAARSCCESPHEISKGRWVTTAIAGVEHEGFVYLAGDRAVSCGDRFQHFQAEPKIFKRGEYVIGICGATRLEMLLKHRVQWPSIAGPTEAAMNVEVADAIRNAAKLTGSPLDPEDTWLVGIHDALYVFDGHCAAYRAQEGFFAIGCGDVAAMSVLGALADRAPKARLLAALQQASRIVPGVRGLPDGSFDWISTLPRKLPALKP